jgi:hypothetical protein
MAALGRSAPVRRKAQCDPVLFPSALCPCAKAGLVSPSMHPRSMFDEKVESELPTPESHRTAQPSEARPEPLCYHASDQV